MEIERKAYTEEYRRESADYALASERPIRQIAKELGINDRTFHTWVRKRKVELGSNGSLPTQVEDTAETKTLKKRMKELEMENEFLKKAAAFFAKEQG
jgi:transposase